MRLFAGRSDTPNDFAYYIVGPRRKMALPKVRAFVEWLRQEAGGMDRAA